MSIAQVLAQLPSDADPAVTRRLAATCLAVTATPPQCDWVMSVAETFDNWLTKARDPGDQQIRIILLAAVCETRRGSMQKHHTGDLMSHLKQLYISVVKHL